MVILGEINCWHELNTDDELTLKTEDDFLRGIEWELRTVLYSWKHIRADMVAEPYVNIPKVFSGADFGIRTISQSLASDSRGGISSSRYTDQLQTEDDLEKILIPEITVDEKASSQNEEMAHNIFDGILDVRMQGFLPAMWGYLPFFGPWDRLAEWKGAENLMYDLYDRPEFIHKIMKRLTEAHLRLLDQLEAKGLLSFGQGLVHCGGAYTDELPAPGFNPLKPRAKDMWTFGAAQIFSSVSPDMHKEFELDYAVKWYERFGLVSYGCCDPLHDKINIVRNIPNLRKISVSPWANAEKSAEGIGKDFVLAAKPNPAFLADTGWDINTVRNELEHILEAGRRHGCTVQLILKDICTVKYKPERLYEWVDLAMGIVG
jgi:hypothetical protein